MSTYFIKPRQYRNTSSSEAIACSSTVRMNNVDAKVESSHKNITEIMAEDIVNSIVNDVIKNEAEIILGPIIGNENADIIAVVVDDIVDPLLDKYVDIVVEEAISVSDNITHPQPDGWLAYFMKFIHLW